MDGQLRCHGAREYNVDGGKSEQPMPGCRGCDRTGHPVTPRPDDIIVSVTVTVTNVAGYGEQRHRVSAIVPQPAMGRRNRNRARTGGPLPADGEYLAGPGHGARVIPAVPLWPHSNHPLNLSRQ